MPTKFEWDSSYSVGNRTLDEQHKKLFEVCNRLGECTEMMGANRTSLFHELLDELARYTKTHFETEEKILAELGYAGLEEQEAEHLAFVGELAILSSDAVFGFCDVQKTYDFIVEWLKGHILGSDMRYKDTLQQNAARTSHR